ncbi:hypothetical protein MKW94_027801 [Papaver nudicaule]|uniref:C2H2-type domain-containing protein n=1 Tax=Papaver nudicaule TaxID=74823 RepID=A0AA41V4W9_PAPNU|nr:hypothetical protein [Papaver nudicaule]
MFPETFSNSTSLSEEVSAGSSHGTTTRLHQDLSPILFSSSDHHHHQHHEQQQQSEETTKIKKKRNLPGNPDPEAEVVALSPRTLMATNRFVCEVCSKGFQRDQNLQLHRRGHNLPWKLKQRSNTDVIRKRVYVCPELSCVHNHPSRALGDLTGIKKHFSRKHGEKKWKCEKCSKKYAVQSDWKAHSKTCGTKEYRCDCGTLFASKVFKFFYTSSLLFLCLVLVCVLHVCLDSNGESESSNSRKNFCLVTKIQHTNVE